MNIIYGVFTVLVVYLAFDMLALAITVLLVREHKVYWSCVSLKTSKGYVIMNILAGWQWLAGVNTFYEEMEHGVYEESTRCFGYFKVVKDGFSGVCNEWGGLIVPCEFRDILVTKEGIIGVRINHSQCFFDFRGKKM